jgi:hypothetical protein
VTPDETRGGDGLLQRRPHLANRAVAGGELSSLARAAYGGACTWRLGVGQQGAGAREACPCPLQGRSTLHAEGRGTHAAGA